MSEIPKYIANPENQTESVNTSIDYANVDKTLDENMDNLLKNVLNTTEKITNDNLYRKWKEICSMECNDKWKNSEIYTTWLVNILDSYLKQEV